MQHRTYAIPATLPPGSGTARQAANAQSRATSSRTTNVRHTIQCNTCYAEKGGWGETSAVGRRHCEIDELSPPASQQETRLGRSPLALLAGGANSEGRTFVEGKFIDMAIAILG